MCVCVCVCVCVYVCVFYTYTHVSHNFSIDRFSIVKITFISLWNFLNIHSDLTYPHTFVLDEIVDKKVGELYK